MGGRIILILTFFSVAAGLVLRAVMPPLVMQAANLSDLPGYIARFTEQSRPLRELGDRYGITRSMQDLAKDLPGR